MLAVLLFVMRLERYQWKSGHSAAEEGMVSIHHPVAEETVLSVSEWNEGRFDASIYWQSAVVDYYSNLPSKTRRARRTFPWFVCMS